jgi:hypothetical protein
MNFKSWFLGYCGFLKPYDFRRATISLICLSLFFIFLLITVISLLSGRIDFGSQSSNFFIYILLLLLISFSLVRFRYLSFFILIFTLTDILIGTAFWLNQRISLSLSAFVFNSKISLENRFKYHPFLVGVPLENFKSTRGLDVRHNSRNMRGDEVPLSSNKKLINIYGGSSTYDVGVPYGYTWPEVLNRKLGSDFIVANFGVPGYSTAEHVMQTAFYSDVLGEFPKCSVYYVGWNDIRNAHIPKLDPGYADFHLLSQMNSLEIRRKNQFFSPFFTVSAYFLKNLFNPVSKPRDLSKLPLGTGSDLNLERIFTKNIDTLAYLNSARGIRTVFIGQILNRAILEKNRSNSSYIWIPLVKASDIWTLQERFNSLLKAEAEKLKVGAIFLDVNKFDGLDFVDEGHFSSKGSKKFAELITADVKRFCY